MIRWSFIFIFVLLSSLGGCAQVLPSRYILPSLPGGRMCVTQCNKILTRCKEQCYLASRSCYIEMRSQALKDFEFYMHDQFMAEQVPDLRASDFEQPEKCAQIECTSSCDGEYNACFVRCGGIVEGNPTPQDFRPRIN